MADALRETIAAFNDLDCGLTIAFGAAERMGLSAANLADITAYVARYRTWAAQTDKRGSTPPWPPTCLRPLFPARKVPAHV